MAGERVRGAGEHTEAARAFVAHVQHPWRPGCHLARDAPVPSGRVAERQVHCVDPQCPVGRDGPRAEVHDRTEAGADLGIAFEEALVRLLRRQPEGAGGHHRVVDEAGPFEGHVLVRRHQHEHVVGRHHMSAGFVDHRRLHPGSLQFADQDLGDLGEEGVLVWRQDHDQTGLRHSVMMADRLHHGPGR
jgi:hypothetical protein